MRQLKEAGKNGIKNTEESQSLLTNNKKSNSKLDNTVIDMIEQPGNESNKESDPKDNV